MLLLLYSVLSDMPYFSDMATVDIRGCFSNNSKQRSLISGGRDILFPLYCVIGLVANSRKSCHLASAFSRDLVSSFSFTSFSTNQ